MHHSGLHHVALESRCRLLLPRLAAALLIAALALPAAAATSDYFPEELSPDPFEAAMLQRDLVHRLEIGRHGQTAIGARHEPAAASALRVADYDVLHYDLELTIDMDADTLDGLTTILIESETGGLTEVLLHLNTLSVHAATIGATPLVFSHVGEDLTITLDRPYAIGETFSIAVDYSGHPLHESWGGFWFYFDMAFNLGVGLYTDPPSMGRYWFPCFDEPQDKATFTAHYTVPEEWMAVGNGLLTGVVEHPAEQTVTYSWDEPHLTSTYLIAVAAADWRIVEDPVYGDWMYHYVLPGDSTNAVGSFQNCHLMMDAYTSRYGPYVWDKFSFVGVRKGDMEHATCVSHLRNLINGGTAYDYLLAHEMSHHWWGDWVTIGDWRDVWLSEGFATYSEAVYQEHIGGMTAYHASMNAIMNYYLNSGETFPMYDPVSMWGATSYEKGGSVLHMLRHIVGESTMLDIFAAWGSTYGFSNAVTTDFIAVAESVSGQELDWFFDQWVFDAGYPRYEWGWYARTGASVDTAYVLIDQVQTTGPVFEMPIDFVVTTAAGDTTLTAVVDEAPELVALPVPGPILDVAFDPDRWVLCRQVEVTVGVTSPPATPAVRQLELGIAAPNPFAVATSMRLTPGDGATPVRVGIYDGTGRLVRLLFDEPVTGERIVEWDGRDGGGREAVSGVYFMRARQRERTVTRRIILLH